MDRERVHELTRQLRDFRTRSAAIEALSAAGKDAVGPLLTALEMESNEGARWAMIHCLGELGESRAVPVLAPFLEQSDYQSVAREALTRIVGRDLGPLPADWLRWAELRPLETGRHLETAYEAEAAEPLTNARLVELALEGSAASWREEDADRFVVNLPLAGGRTQRVTLAFGAADHEGAEIVIVYSDCGEANPAHYEAVLRRNLRMPYGAVALRDAGDKSVFVMFNTILRHALSPIELRKSIFTIGERAHRVERQLMQ